jgi:hypothetical protein
MHFIIGIEHCQSGVKRRKRQTRLFASTKSISNKNW